MGGCLSVGGSYFIGMSSVAGELQIRKGKPADAVSKLVRDEMEPLREP